MKTVTLIPAAGALPRLLFTSRAALGWAHCLRLPACAAQALIVTHDGRTRSGSGDQPVTRLSTRARRALSPHMLCKPAAICPQPRPHYSIYALHHNPGQPRANYPVLPDQIARQVEDPGLKHSSQTHVGLELSIRHAAEFFAFYICRFILADLGLLMDRFVKKGTEWALA